MKYYVILYVLLFVKLVFANDDPEDAPPTDEVAKKEQTATTSYGGFDDPYAALSDLNVPSIHDLVKDIPPEYKARVLANVPSAHEIIETIDREVAEEALFPLDEPTEVKTEEKAKPTLPSAVDITIDIFSLDKLAFYVNKSDGETTHTTILVAPNRAVKVKSGSIVLWKAENDNEHCVFLDLFTKGENELLALTIINDRTSETKALYGKYDKENGWTQVKSQLYHELWDQLGFTLDNTNHTVDYSDEYLKFPPKIGRIKARRVGRFLRLKPVLNVVESDENTNVATIDGYSGLRLQMDDDEDDEKSSVKKTHHLVGDLNDSTVVEYTPSRLPNAGSVKSVSDLDDPEPLEEASTKSEAQSSCGEASEMNSDEESVVEEAALKSDEPLPNEESQTKVEEVLPEVNEEVDVSRNVEV